MAHQGFPEARSVQVLMVCLGNICRSPTAHAVLLKYIENEGLQDHIKVDSAGTGAWYLGEAPDPRAIQAAAGRGYDLSPLRARQVEAGDFSRFDYILAMDRNNLRELRASCPDSHHSKLRLFLEFADSSHESVPDPYYSGAQGFELVLDLVEDACAGLMQEIRRRHLADRQPGGREA